MKYYCKECKLAVLVLENSIVKGCRCEAPIIADADVVLYSTSQCGNNPNSVTKKEKEPLTPEQQKTMQDWIMTLPCDAEKKTKLMDLTRNNAGIQ